MATAVATTTTTTSVEKRPVSTAPAPASLSASATSSASPVERWSPGGHPLQPPLSGNEDTAVVHELYPAAGTPASGSTAAGAGNSSSSGGGGGSCLGAPGDPRVAVVSPLIVFDWDDTMLTSSWIQSRELLQAGSYEDLPAEARRDLANLEQSVIKCLTTARSLGTMIIITNAESGWVELSAAKFFVNLLPLLEGVPVVSARSLFEAQFPGSPLCWKSAAFAYMMHDHFLEHPRWTPKMVMSIGDSNEEKVAMRIASGQHTNITAKAVKFVSGPDPEALTAQLDIVTTHLEWILSREGDAELILSYDMINGIDVVPMRSCVDSPPLHGTPGPNSPRSDGGGIWTEAGAGVGGGGGDGQQSENSASSGGYNSQTHVQHHHQYDDHQQSSSTPSLPRYDYTSSSSCPIPIPGQERGSGSRRDVANVGVRVEYGDDEEWDSAEGYNNNNGGGGGGMVVPAWPVTRDEEAMFSSPTLRSDLSSSFTTTSPSSSSISPSAFCATGTSSASPSSSSPASFSGRPSNLPSSYCFTGTPATTATSSSSVSSKSPSSDSEEEEGGEGGGGSDEAELSSSSGEVVMVSAGRRVGAIGGRGERDAGVGGGRGVDAIVDVGVGFGEDVLVTMASAPVA